MFEFIKYIDLFGKEFTFNTNGARKYKTVFGGLLTIISLLIIFSISFIFAKNFIYRMNPKILNQRISLEDYPLEVIKSENFTIAWRLEDPYGNFINNSLLFAKIKHYYYQEVKNETYTKFEENTVQKIKSKKCKDMETTLQNEFTKDFEINEWDCLDISSPILMGGDWNTPFLHYIEFILNSCDDNNKCSSFEDLEKFIEEQSPYISFLFPELTERLESYENPIVKKYKNYYVKLDIGIINFDFCSFFESFLVDDKDLLYDNPIYSKSIGFSNCRTSTTFRDKSKYKQIGVNQDFYYADFYLGKNIQKITRSYMKINEAAALMGGIQSIIFLIFNFLSLYSYDYRLDKMLIDVIFKNPINQEENKKLFEELKIKNNDYLMKTKINKDLINVNNDNENNNNNLLKKKTEALRKLNNKADKIRETIRKNLPVIETGINPNYSSNDKNNKKINFYSPVRFKLENLNELSEINDNKLNKKNSKILSNNISKIEIQNENDFTQNKTPIKEKEKVKEKNKGKSKGIENFDLIKINKENSTFLNLNSNIDLLNSTERKIVEVKDKQNENFNENNLNDKSINKKDDPIDFNIWVSMTIKNLINKKIKLFSEIDVNIITYNLPCLIRNKKKTKEIQYFFSAMNKISKRIDLISYMKNYQITKLISKIILNDEQYFYFKNNSKEIINIPFIDEDKIKSLKKNNRFDKFILYVEKIAKEELENLSHADINILKSLFEF